MGFSTSKTERELGATELDGRLKTGLEFQG